MGYLYLNLDTGRGEYACAGHHALLAREKPAKATREIAAYGTLFGLRVGTFATNPVQFDLRPGQRILFYTDGLTDVRNESGEIFGIENLSNLFSAQDESPPSQAIDAILKGLQKWAGPTPFPDDVTAIMIDIE